MTFSLQWRDLWKTNQFVGHSFWGSSLRCIRVCDFFCMQLFVDEVGAACNWGWEGMRNIEHFAWETWSNHAGEIGLGANEVLTAVFMKKSVMWVISRCSPLKNSRRFGGTCRFVMVSSLALLFALKMEMKYWLIFNGLDGWSEMVWRRLWPYGYHSELCKWLFWFHKRREFLKVSNREVAV
jgi:hypothetical protein